MLQNRFSKLSLLRVVRDLSNNIVTENFLNEFAEKGRKPQF